LKFGTPGSADARDERAGVYEVGVAIAVEITAIRSALRVLRKIAPCANEIAKRALALEEHLAGVHARLARGDRIDDDSRALGRRIRTGITLADHEFYARCVVHILTKEQIFEIHLFRKISVVGHKEPILDGLKTTRRDFRNVYLRCEYSVRQGPNVL
jgi:hypothetical protein